MRSMVVLAFSAALAAVAPAQSPAGYGASVASVARRQACDDSVADPGARTIFLTTGAPTPRAVVLLHGLTDSPRQFESLAQLLRAGGDNVYVPRFPQHGLRGGDAHSLGALRAEQLRQFADSVLVEARGLGDTLVVLGLSMGGTTAAWIAQHRAVSRVVLVAPAIEPARIPSLLDRPIVGLADRLPNVTLHARLDSARPDREVGFSSRASAEILELGRAVMHDARRLRPATNRLVMLVNANDRTVRESVDVELAQDWTRHDADVDVYELPDSLRLPHNIVDPLRGRVGGDAVLRLLRELVHGEPPSALVRPVPVHIAEQRGNR